MRCSKGHAISSTQKFCAECGEPIQQSQGQFPRQALLKALQPEARASSRGRRPLLLVGVAVLALAAVIAAPQVMSDTVPKDSSTSDEGNSKQISSPEPEDLCFDEISYWVQYTTGAVDIDSAMMDVAAEFGSSDSRFSLIMEVTAHYRGRVYSVGRDEASIESTEEMRAGCSEIANDLYS